MSANPKPTLAGVQVKTRKRNIVVPSDPGSFADAVIQVFLDASDGVSLQSDLDAAVKALGDSELDFSRYGDTLFEVLFAGGRLTTGGNLAEGAGTVLPTTVLKASADREGILPFIKVFQTLIRRRPFLIKALENTLVKFILSLDFYDQAGRQKIAIATALVFSQKLGALPENVLSTLLNDRLVAKGTVLEFITNFFKEYLSKDSLEDLVTLLTKAKLVHRLLDFFPPSKRSPAGFNEHFEAAGLLQLVEWNKRRELDAKVQELQDQLVSMLQEDPPHPVGDVLSFIKAKKTENSLPDPDILRVLWVAVTKSVNMTGKNQQQILQAVLKQVKTYRKVLNAFASSAKGELALLVTVQVLCYEDNRLLKLFSDIVRVLYDADVVGEDTILHWYKKGSNPKGRNVFLKDIEPFIKWLEEAEEEEGDA